jgi:hypothetical protein
MPETAQADPVSQFQSLPRDRQTALLKKMSPEQKQKLKAGIDKKLAAKNAKPSDPNAITTDQGLAKARRDTLGREVGSLVSNIVGIPGAIKHAVTDPVTAEEAQRQGLKPGDSRASINPLDRLVVRPIANAADWYKQAAQGKIPDPTGQALSVLPEAIGAGAAAPITEKLGEMAPSAIKALPKTISDAIPKEVPRSLTKAATQTAIEDMIHKRGMGIRDHIQEVADRVQQEDSERWQHISDTVDKAKPEGAIDLSQIRNATQGNVDATIKAPQKLPGGLEDIRKGGESPKVFGSKLDPTNPSHAALIQKLKEAGALPDNDAASFAKVRQMRSKLGRELNSHSSTLSGESKSVGWKLYGDYTNAMKAAADEHGMAGAFDDANKFHQQYMEHFGNPDALLGKAMRGENASETMEPLSSPKTAAQAREMMKNYTKHGLDPAYINREGMIFQKLSSGLPRQLGMSRFELMADVPSLGTASLPRLGYNLAERAKALHDVAQPPKNPVMVRAQALKAAAEKLGPKASIKDIMAEADKATPQQ